MSSVVHETNTPLVDTALAAHTASLVAALARETALIGDLRTALQQQRDGIAGDDPALVDQSTQAVARTLLSLDQARRHRVTVTAQLTNGTSADLDTLEDIVGALPGDLKEARRTVRRAAGDAAVDLRINQSVLKRALEAGNAFLQKLFSSAGEVSAAYDPADRSTDQTGSSGVLLNRTA